MHKEGFQTRDLLDHEASASPPKLGFIDILKLLPPLAVVKQLGRAYNKELKWFMGRQMPTFEDYFANTVYMSCIYVMLTVPIPGMQSASEESIDWLMSEPKILMATVKMGRYVEDLGTHEKDLNTEWVTKTSTVPKDTVKQLLNYARLAAGKAQSHGFCGGLSLDGWRLVIIVGLNLFGHFELLLELSLLLSTYKERAENHSHHIHIQIPLLRFTFSVSVVFSVHPMLHFLWTLLLPTLFRHFLTSAFYPSPPINFQLIQSFPLTSRLNLAHYPSRMYIGANGRVPRGRLSAALPPPQNAISRMAFAAFTPSVNLRFRPLPTPKPRRPATHKALRLSTRFRIRNSINNSNNTFSYDPIHSTKQKSAFLLPAPKRKPITVASSSAAAAPAVSPAPQQQPWQGAAMKPLLASIATGVIIWFLPRPDGVSRIAWQLLSIFLATIVGIITQPLPLGAVALMGLGACVLTKTLTFAAAFSAFGDPIPWLIALAFFFARGFIKTGLGNRIAYQFVSLFGSSSLGLCYSLVFSEALLAPAIPSVSARAGGIFLPLVKSLSVACGSNVGDGTENRLGSWLMLTCFQTSVISSSMFLTGMAANPLAANLTASTINMPIGWVDWAKAAIVPGLVSLVVVPFLLYIIYPPTVKSSPDAPKLAKEKLEKMGPMSKNEMIMAGTLLLTVGLWISGSILNVDAVSAAILGLTALLVTGVVTWKECLAESVAWDTLTWFAALIAMAGYLNKYGLISWFSQTVVKPLRHRMVDAPARKSEETRFNGKLRKGADLNDLKLSGAAHIGAMFTAFLSVASALGTPPYLGACVLSFVSNLMGGITHYGIGSAPVFYGAGYVPLAKWWGYGFLISVVNLIIWLGVGGVWWKAIGLW
ncbi:Dicarboxylate transporter 1, chloroplastic [Sesamum angolense]|uniref:Dicarboxylate transporter 1, chloroplastic n=1 Tax=Sesamum angolense TaxID=2727404 RepID=A0AAE1X9P1_9LAMI|nr:Dicarboxylate transporter 1, chloroplastic [Sesamum angolense]